MFANGVTNSWVDVTFAVLGILAIDSMPFLIVYNFFINKKKLDSEKYAQKEGYFSKDLNIDRNREWAFMIPLSNNIRFIIIGLTVTLLDFLPFL